MAAPNGMNFGKVPRVFLSMKLIQRSNFRVQGMFFNNCIEKNQNKTHFEEGSSSHTILSEGSGYQTDEFSETIQTAFDPQIV